MSTTPTVPTTPATPAASRTERPWIMGVVLIGIGLLLLAGQLFEQNDWLILGVLAVVFLALYATTRKSGWVIPGMILGGLAIGLGFEDYGYSVDGSSVLLGLAAGFLAIYAFNWLTHAKAQWWPLIPGTILGVIGISLAIGGTEMADTVAQWWPVALIVVGLAILFGSRQQLMGRSKT